MGHSDSRPATGGVRFKTGIVSDIDPGSGTVRVDFDDVGIPSDWLPVCYPKAMNDKAYWMPDVGEQVRCIMDEHLEDGTVLGAIYSQADAVPWESADKCGWLFRDGGSFTYDRSTGIMSVNTIKDLDATVGGNLTADVTGDATIKAATITLDAATTTITGDLKVGGSAAIAGDVTGGSISLENHTHEYDHGTTSKPQ